MAFLGCKGLERFYVFLLKSSLHILQFFHYYEDFFHISVSYWLLLAEREVINFLYLSCSQILQILLLILMPFSLEFSVFKNHSHISKTFVTLFQYLNINILISFFTHWITASNKCGIIVITVAMAVLFLILMTIVLFCPTVGVQTTVGFW